MRTLIISLGALGVWCLAGLLPAAAADDTLDRVAALTRGGAPHLALELLRQNEPAAGDAGRRLAWERRRLEILRALKDWDGIAQVAETLPAEAPPEFRRAVLFEAAEARLAAGDASGAQRLLRRLTFQELAGGAELARARRLIIRSYLADGDLDDAQIALVCYRAEHGRGAAWQALHAEILLRQKKPAQAFEVLAGAQSYETRLLRLLAALHARLYTPRDAQLEAARLAGELRAQPELRRQALVVAAEAARYGKDLDAQVRLLEEALGAEAAVHAAGLKPEPVLFRVGADGLWSAYEQLAQAVGNRERLVIGDDQAWVGLARRYGDTDRKKGKTARAQTENRHVGRALHAFLARAAADPAVRDSAHRQLAALLFADERGDVAQALYTRSARFASIAQIPAAVRHRLADKALGDFDIRLAADLIRDLAEPPPDDDDPEGWTLRRARILVYGGDYAGAAGLMQRLIDSRPRLDQDLAERALQVMFDFQSVGRHDEALGLLQAVYARVDNERIQREVLFWQADSQAALRRHREAAELYLRSATHGGASGGDPWGHTASFFAAEQLHKAGLTRDARDVYQRLLAVTTDPKRRLVIERQMQQLWLAPPKASAP